MIAKKNYSFSSKDEDAVLPEEDTQDDPFVAAVADIDKVEVEVDVDEEDEIDDGVVEGEDDEEAQLGAHGFHVVTDEDDNEM